MTRRRRPPRKPWPLDAWPPLIIAAAVVIAIALDQHLAIWHLITEPV